MLFLLLSSFKLKNRVRLKAYSIYFDRRKKIKASIKDVAKIAKVSYATVSKYINKKPYVSKETGKKIEKAIKKLNYKPDMMARGLVYRKSNCIGLIIRDISNPYYGAMIHGIENCMAESKVSRKYTLILSNTRNYWDSIEEYIDSLLMGRVEGIISTSENISSKYLKYLKKINIPVVFIGCYKEDKEFDFSYITIDDFKTGFDLTEYLINKGHEKIVHITSNMKASFADNRRKGYLSALRKNKININSEDIIFIKTPSIESGYLKAEEIFKRKDLPTAVFCVNDAVAYGFLNYCSISNIKVPDDISVVGVDDNIYSSLNYVNLTTIRDPIEDIGRMATEILLEKIIRKNQVKVIKIIKPEIIIRNSVKEIKS